MAGVVPGYSPGNAVNAAAYQSAYATLATMTGVPSVGNPEAVAQRLEELTNIVGTLAEALSHTAPAINTATNNNDLIVACIANIQQHISTVETKAEWLEAQRANSPGSNV